MNTERFVVGDRVVQGDRHGEITVSFYTPEKKIWNDVPVQWDDGTSSYVNPGSLDYEEI